MNDITQNIRPQLVTNNISDIQARISWLEQIIQGDPAHREAATTALDRYRSALDAFIRAQQGFSQSQQTDDPKEAEQLCNSANDNYDAGKEYATTAKGLLLASGLDLQQKSAQAVWDALEKVFRQNDDADLGENCIGDVEQHPEAAAEPTGASPQDDSVVDAPLTRRHHSGAYWKRSQRSPKKHDIQKEGSAQPEGVLPQRTREILGSITFQVLNSSHNHRRHYYLPDDTQEAAFVLCTDTTKRIDVYPAGDHLRESIEGALLLARKQWPRSPLHLNGDPQFLALAAEIAREHGIEVETGGRVHADRELSADNENDQGNDGRRGGLRLV